MKNRSCEILLPKKLQKFSSILSHVAINMTDGGVEDEFELESVSASETTHIDGHLTENPR